MIEKKLVFTWRLMILAFVMPLLLILAIDISISSGIQGYDSEIAFTRFANATLTAYTLCSLVLLGNLFFYGESRNRPRAHLSVCFLPQFLELSPQFSLLIKGQCCLKTTVQFVLKQYTTLCTCSFQQVLFSLP